MFKYKTSDCIFSFSNPYQKVLFASILIVAGLFTNFSCTSSSSDAGNKLKIYTKKEVVNGDSSYVVIPAFSFTDQENNTVTNETLKGKIYVTDFFFTSCPSICPRMKSQMKRVYDKFKDEPDVLLLSHSIDPTYDTPEVLKAFSDKLEIDASKWHMVTGDKDAIYDMAKYYMVTALEDPKAPGGYAHSGHFVLVDKQGLIRGYYDGTEALDVNRLMEDLVILLNEK